MITLETVEAIFLAMREIAAGEKLLEDLSSDAKKPDFMAPKLVDAFGRKRPIQLGVPTGDSCHRLFDVSPELAVSVIRAHIAAQRAKLAEANERARIELESGA